MTGDWLLETGGYIQCYKLQLHNRVGNCLFRNLFSCVLTKMGKFSIKNT